MKLQPFFDSQNTWHLQQPGATAEDIDRLEQLFGLGLPTDYRELISWSNGGDFIVGKVYFRLWSIEDVERRNRILDVQRRIHGSLVIGNDAGDFLYLLDYVLGTDEPAFVELEAGNLDRSDAIVHGTSLTAALRSWSGIDAARARLLGCLAARASKA
jgi:hypothetical protein